MNTELMTPAEVARVFVVKPKTIYEWAANGKIPCVRINTLLRFKRSEIDYICRNGLQAPVCINNISKPEIKKIKNIKIKREPFAWEQ